MKYLMLTIFMLAGCSDQSVEKWFENNKSGNSADFGVFKGYNDHVITVHGFWDDKDVCQQIIDMLHKEQPDAYICMTLN